MACLCVVQRDGIEPVATHLDTDGAFRVSLEEVAEPTIRQAPSCRRPSLRLFELITMLLVIEEVGEV